MKKLDLQFDGHPYRLNDLKHVQNSLIEIATALGSGFNANQAFIISGAEITGAGPFNVSEGYIYFEEEIFKVPAKVGVPGPGVGEQGFFNKAETTENPKDLSSPYPVTYQDNTVRNVHLTRTMDFVFAVTGHIASDSVRTLPAILPQFDRQSPIGGIIMYSGDVVTNFPGTGLGDASLNLQNWALCNGNNGAPDLQGQFIVGLSSTPGDYDTIGNDGGEEKHVLLKEEMAPHSHHATAAGGTLETSADGAHRHNSWKTDKHDDIIGAANDRETARVDGGSDNGTATGQGGEGPVTRNPASVNDTLAGAHDHTITGRTGNAADDDLLSDAHENRPPYYTLAYIMRVT